MRKVSILFRKAPYGSVNNVEGFRVCTALAAYGAIGREQSEIDTNAIFIDDGVFAALKGQDPKGIGLPPEESAYKKLVDLDVKLYILEEALRERGIAREDLIETEYTIIDRSMLSELISQSDFTMSF